MKKVKTPNRSGRKRSKKRNKKTAPKPVSEFIHFKAKGNKEGFVNIRIGDNGEVQCEEAEEGTLSHYRGYMRDSGKEKRTVRSFSKSGTAFPTQKENIINNYDVLAGIDTNDYVFEDRSISIAVSYYAKSINANNVVFAQIPPFIISNVKNNLNSEVIGWYLFIKHCVPLLNVNEDITLGLVVDSELGRHPAFNRREEPYYNDNYLPKKIGLIYASSDTGTDLPNQLIKLCDSESRRLFRMIQKRELVLPSQLGVDWEGKDYLGYVYVNNVIYPMPA